MKALPEARELDHQRVNNKKQRLVHQGFTRTTDLCCTNCLSLYQTYTQTHGETHTFAHTHYYILSETELNLEVCDCVPVRTFCPVKN